MEEKPEIQCSECGWQGDVDELVSKTIHPWDKDFSYCPECGSDDIEDYED